jgi:hypothetical protein
MDSHRLNALSSYGFRSAIGAHLLLLCILFFVLKNTVVAEPHHVVAVCVTALMAIVATLFVLDMTTRKQPERKNAKLIDGVVGCAWFATC